MDEYGIMRDIVVTADLGGWDGWHVLDFGIPGGSFGDLGGGFDGASAGGGGDVGEEVVVTGDPLPYTAGWDGDQFVVRAYDFANETIHVGSVSDAGTFTGEQLMTPDAAWDALPFMVWPGGHELIV